jgi:hypothetical protein
LAYPHDSLFTNYVCYAGDGVFQLAKVGTLGCRGGGSGQSLEEGASARQFSGDDGADVVFRKGVLRLRKN